MAKYRRVRACKLSNVPLFAVVDDNEPMREALSELIEVFGFECLMFDGSESFLAAHEQGRFAGLITDLNLLGESGLQLQQRLKVLERALPVIVISAQTDTQTRMRALVSGVIAYLTKPINDTVLLQQLNLALDRGRGMLQTD